MTEREDQPNGQAVGVGRAQPSHLLVEIEHEIRTLMSQLSMSRSTVRQLESEQHESMRKILLDLLEIIDAFERVFRSVRAKEAQVTPQMKIWVGNFRTVEKLLEKILIEQGVAKMENLDQTFDPHWHRVSELVSDPSKAEGTIADEVRSGYVWRGQVLRKAEVTVVGSPEQQSE